VAREALRGAGIGARRGAKLGAARGAMQALTERAKPDTGRSKKKVAAGIAAIGAALAAVGAYLVSRGKQEAQEEVDQSATTPAPPPSDTTNGSPGERVQIS
jgi:hypothetical protein